MRLIIILLIAIFSPFGTSFGQAPDTLWTRIFGGDGDDRADYVDHTNDNGFVAAGCSDSFGETGDDIYIVKVDPHGNEEWSRLYRTDVKDRAYCIQQTQDGGYILTGYVGMTVYGNDGEIVLIKLDESGLITWVHRYGGEYYDAGYSVQQTNDLGYIITGTSNSPVFNNHNIVLIKTDSRGTILWRRFFGNLDDEIGESVRQTSDGGYIIAGWKHSNITVNMWIIKTDALGNVQWERIIGGSGAEYGYCVRETNDLGFIVAGSTTTWGLGNHTAMLIKLDSFGNTQWTQFYGDIAWDCAKSVRQTKDLGYVFTGITDVCQGGAHDVWIVKTDVLGNILWTKRMEGDNYDWGECIQALSDGSFIVAARYGQDSGGGDFWLIRLESEYDSRLSASTGMKPMAAGIVQFELHTPYPNPFNPTTVISFQLPASSRVNLKVYDVSGHLVQMLVDGWRDVGVHEVVFDAKDLTSGVYFARLTTGDLKQTRKILLIK